MTLVGIQKPIPGVRSTAWEPKTLYSTNQEATVDPTAPGAGRAQQEAMTTCPEKPGVGGTEAHRQHLSSQERSSTQAEPGIQGWGLSSPRLVSTA